MKTYINKNTVIIICGAVAGIFLIWLAGFGFGNEIKLSKLLGITFLGNAYYLGTWFNIIAICIVGFCIPYIIVRFVFKEKLRDYGFCFSQQHNRWFFEFQAAKFCLPGRYSLEHRYWSDIWEIIKLNIANGSIW